MVRAAGEIDFVADVETKADRSEAAFDAGTGIQNAGEIIERRFSIELMAVPTVAGRSSRKKWLKPPLTVRKG